MHNLRQIARRVVALDGVSRLLCRFNPRPRIMMLHGVGGPDFSEAAFRSVLAFLSRNFRIVPLDEIWQADEGSRPKMALTFDDGLRNNLVSAYPILREFRAPATFFVCPGLIESGSWLWNHECRARLASLPAGKREGLAETLALAGGSVETIVQKLKYLPCGERAAAQERLREISGSFRPSAAQRQRYDVMSWAELKSLDRELIGIGGHSVHHEILTGIDPEHLEREVGECRVWLERELGRPVRHFCYPDGAYNPAVRACVGRHFESAVTVREDFVGEAPELLELPRIPIADSVPDLAWRVQRPAA